MKHTAIAMLLVYLMAIVLTIGGDSGSSCDSHEQCKDVAAPFCYVKGGSGQVGTCQSCDYCVSCIDGVNGECGPCEPKESKDDKKKGPKSKDKKPKSTDNKPKPKSNDDKGDEDKPKKKKKKKKSDDKKPKEPKQDEEEKQKRGKEGEPCEDHGECRRIAPFCKKDGDSDEGVCARCSECLSCSDGIDETCGRRCERFFPLVKFPIEEEKVCSLPSIKVNCKLCENGKYFDDCREYQCFADGSGPVAITDVQPNCGDESYCVSFGEPSDFELRREALMTAFIAPDSSLSFQNEKDTLVLQAYKGLDLDQENLADSLAEMSLDNKNVDFDLIRLVRVLYLVGEDAEIESSVYDAVSELQPFWVTDGDLVQYYWTENHMIMWDSSAFLLKQKYDDLTVDDNLYNRLVSYLQLKIDYGYFEVNSAVYFPYTMSALLNLADFSEDVMIQDLAVQALQRLLLSVIDSVNSNGSFFPAQGRSTAGRFDSEALASLPTNDLKVIELLTGLSSTYDRATPGSVFVATTGEANLAGVLNTWERTIESKTSTNGIAIPDFATFNDEVNYPLSDDSRVAFQMSAGAYWIPEFVQDTIAFVNQFNLWAHPEFAPWQQLMYQPGPAYFGLSYDDLVPITRGAVISDIESVLFKDGPSMLSSFQDYNFQFVGIQQYPYVASTGTIAVYGSSPGADGPPFDFRNLHLPKVQQVKNAALVMYDSTEIKKFNVLLSSFGVEYYGTRFLWPAGFDEERVVGLWFLGKEIGADGVEGYVALRQDSACNPAAVVGDIYCVEDQQVYALFVGNSDEYEDFDNFATVVQDSQYDDNTRTLTIDGVTVSL